MARSPAMKYGLTEGTEKALMDYFNRMQNNTNGALQIRDEMEAIDRKYMRETDWTVENQAARQLNRAGDMTKYRNVTVPVIMPQVEAAMTYYMNAFLMQFPIFKVLSTPENADTATQMQAIVAENSVSAGWARQLLMFFRDGLKYNLHAVECDWETRTTFNVGNNMTSPGGKEVTRVMWKGNVIRRMDMYNTFFDPRVAPADMHKDGEFVGYHRWLSRPAFKELANSLHGQADVPRVVQALESRYPTGGVAGITAAGVGAPFSYYIPSVNPFPMQSPSSRVMDWMLWAHDLPQRQGVQKNFASSYLVTKLYCRIVPSDFGIEVPERNTPQVWKFYVVNGHCILHFERLTNAHGYIPIFFGQPLEDGLDLQTKSFAGNAADLQDVASAMMNGFIASKRRLVGDRILFDPLRVSEAAINNPNPAAKIPVRQGAYGKPLSEAVYQFPFHDEATGTLLTGLSLITNMADKVNGQNPAQQGQFVKGNKTQTEYQDIMGHGNGRNQAMALMTEHQVFAPLKEVIKLNILQYQEDTEVTMPYSGETVPVDGLTLRQKAVQFEVGDGVLPAEKLMHTDEFVQALQVIGSSQELGAGFNLAPMFSYLMQQRGVDLRPFQKTPEQRMFEQQLAAWQQAAAEAAKAGAPFNTPQPQPPQQQTMQTGQSPATRGKISTQGDNTSVNPTSRALPTNPVQPGGAPGSAVQSGAATSNQGSYRSAG